MAFRILERTILADLVKTTILALIASSALLVIVGAMVEARSHGVDPIQVLSYMPYLIAPTLPYTMPSCLLFACTMVYGGMSSANEITAVKAGGIHLSKVLWPAGLLSAGFFAIELYMVDKLIPTCNREFASAIVADVQGTMYAYLQQQGALVQPGFPYEIYVRNVQDEKLNHVVIKHRNPQGGYDMVAKANEATLKVIAGPGVKEPRVEARLIDGVASTGIDNSVHFRDKTIEMPLPKMADAPKEKLEALSFDGLKERWGVLQKIADKQDEDLASSSAVGALTGDPVWIADAVETNFWITRSQYSQINQAQAEFHLRLAHCIAAVPFVLLGAALSIQHQKRDFLRTFFICFLPIITIYYPAMIFAFNLAKENAGILLFVLWVPSIVLTLASLPFLRRAIRH